MTTIRVSDEVTEAIRDGRPVLALESTIFTHGLPRPRNLDVALEAEAGLRAQGVVPATIGVFHGVPTVGLSVPEISELAYTDGIDKVSLRDLPVAIALGLHGGTTVAATAFLAHHAGIRVFSTGGLGGVHHGASESFDESADMTVLAATPVLVISAGVKSILDVAATLERFETLNIPVLGYGTTRYPGFYVVGLGPLDRVLGGHARAGRGGDRGARRARAAAGDPAGQPGRAGQAAAARGARRDPRPGLVAGGGATASPATRPRRSCSTSSSATPAAAASR